VLFAKTIAEKMGFRMDAAGEYEVEDITRQFAEATNLSLISVC